MSQLDGLEKSLDNIFVKNAPFQIPENGRKTIANIMPWLAGLGVLLYAWSVWAFYKLFQVADNLGRFANELSRAYGGGTVYDSSIGALGWFWIIVAGFQVVLLAAAVPGLMKKTKAGWNFVFYSELVGIVATVVSLFRGANAGYGFVSGIIGTVVGLYILFQIRSQYTGAGTKA